VGGAHGRLRNRPVYLLNPRERCRQLAAGGIDLAAALVSGYQRVRPLPAEDRAALPIELVLVSHGDPVLQDGAAALDRALAV